MTWLGVDMGGTATRWALCDAAGTVVARGTAAGSTALGLLDAAQRADFEAALGEVAKAVGTPVAGAVLGLTGSGLDSGRETAGVIAPLLGVPAARVVVLNDMVLAWHAVFPEGRGHLVAAGTGSVGLSIDAQGKVTLVGGRGTLIDDAGSGAWIALRALDAVWRAVDHHGQPEGCETLARALFDAMGGDDWEATRRYVYGGNRGVIGALAPAVAQAADAGDPFALTLMTRAGNELARLAHALLARCGPAPVAAIGGALRLHPAILDAFEAALPGVARTYPAPDVAAHAARMAWAQFGKGS
jgi:glucosamine kinase